MKNAACLVDLLHLSWIGKLLDSSSTTPEIRFKEPDMSKCNIFFKVTFGNNPNVQP